MNLLTFMGQDKSNLENIPQQTSQNYPEEFFSNTPQEIPILLVTPFYSPDEISNIDSGKEKHKSHQINLVTIPAQYNSGDTEEEMIKTADNRDIICRSRNKKDSRFLRPLSGNCNNRRSHCQRGRSRQ